MRTFVRIASLVLVIGGLLAFGLAAHAAYGPRWGIGVADAVNAGVERADWETVGRRLGRAAVVAVLIPVITPSGAVIWLLDD